MSLFIARMPRGIKVLIISGLLFLSSIIIFFTWGVSFSGIFVQNNPSLSTSQVNIEPLQSSNASIAVNSTSKLLSVTIDATNNEQIPLMEVVIDPAGNILSNSTFQNTYFTTITPDRIGDYKLLITNLDPKKTANVYLFFGNLPFLNENGEIDLTIFGGLVLGVILFVAGIIALIVGIILYVKDRNKEKFRGYIPR
ncbi:hypothetical protein [Candidatus Nitrosocosmicus sp. SS]|jgi:hypothetical protein|uniref:hypothetical protein n=1 Tax=Candidatus Nitrosocosmicus agrestis TaxID=2563600 RepID=UPI00122DE5CC|nr:hypothetical protein [Candidatus Nitrosocosmicus sp. SS]KAA2279257.1 hypothetical protein F1Z66_13730 [Candidatus Nitrosocosmicus sp. SS]KAF0867891.1 hypothetical protein E5N71_13110 [Candidatus Nitrosocosmicus sp. SS]